MLKAYFNKNIIEVGCDEAGRGCLAGPVFAAAVILPQNFRNDLLNDSKKLREAEREALRVVIEEKALAFSVQRISAKRIDQINILNASIQAMHKSIAALELRPEHILVDGNRFHLYSGIPHTCIIKGDGQYASIAAASILAKTYRDDYMKKLHKRNSEYNWAKNKGYPTKEHREFIARYGVHKEHRKTFRLLS